MLLWREDISTCTLEEMLGLKDENRAWGKELRVKNIALVNSRLANAITQADYREDRKVGHEAAAEWQRRTNLIDAQLVANQKLMIFR